MPVPKVNGPDVLDDRPTDVETDEVDRGRDVPRAIDEVDVAGCTDVVDCGVGVKSDTCGRLDEETVALESLQV